MIAGLKERLAVPAEHTLDRLIAWMGIALVVSVVGFAAYYWYDRQPGAAGPTPLERQVSAYEQAVRDDPSALGPRLGLADLYFAAGRYADSVEQYQASLAIDDKNLVAVWGLARAQFSAGDAPGAEANFQKVVDASKDADVRGDLVGAAYYFLGKIALDRRDPDAAIASLKQAAAIDRADADAIYLLGAAYVAKGSYDEAMEQLTKAIRFVPDFAEAYGQMALVYDAKGMASEARYARGMELFSQGQLPKAAKELEAATSALPSFAGGFVGLGLVKEKQGQKQAAVNAYQQALQLEPENFNARQGLVRLGVIQSGATTDAHSGIPGAPAPDPHSGLQGGGQ